MIKQNDFLYIVYNFGEIRSSNPTVYTVNNNTFRHITPNISECPRPILIYFTGLVGVLVGMIIPIFFGIWRLHKGRCYGNQLNLGDVRRHHQKRPLLFALAFDNGLADHKSAFKR